MARSPQQVGKDFERALEGAFKSLSKSHGFKHHKLVDTYQAGNVVNEQPSDYLVTCGSNLMFVEAKASSTSKRLRPSMLGPSQRGAIQVYQRMLQCPYQVLFHSEVTGEVHLFKGSDILQSDFSKNYRGYLGWNFGIEYLAENLAIAWSLPGMKETLNTYRAHYEEGL